MTPPCNACRWRTQASTCEMQLIAGPVGQSVLWCAHVEHCPHDAVRRDVERLALLPRIGRAELIAEIERDHGVVHGRDVRDAFSALWDRRKAPGIMELI